MTGTRISFILLKSFTAHRSHHDCHGELFSRLPDSSVIKVKISTPPPPSPFIAILSSYSVTDDDSSHYLLNKNHLQDDSDQKSFFQTLCEPWRYRAIFPHIINKFNYILRAEIRKIKNNISFKKQMEFYYCAAFEKKRSAPKSKLSSNDSMKIGSIYRHLYG